MITLFAHCWGRNTVPTTPLLGIHLLRELRASARKPGSSHEKKRVKRRVFKASNLNSIFRNENLALENECSLAQKKVWRLSQISANADVNTQT